MCFDKASLLRTFSCTSLLVWILFLHTWQSSTLVSAWENCSFTDGGGSCPDGSTCCPSQSQGISACVPTVHSNLPESSKTGQCCGDNITGCPFGYTCTETYSQQQDISYKICTPTNNTINEDPWARDVPRYQLCRVPPTMQQLHGFPIPVPPQSQGIQPCASKDNDINHHCNDQDDDQEDDLFFHLGYYSSQGEIINNVDRSHHQHVETVVIMIHGSLRDADDYFCTGLTLLEDIGQQSDTTTTTTTTDDKILILAPWFPTVSDDISTKPSPKRLLVWDDLVPAYNSFLWHIWRYGADAKNAPISSFTALDSMVEYLVTETENFPKLQQIVVVGHSAGGQMAHRWALLSNSAAWTVLDIRVVVANPRSYCYLDERRWYFSDTTDNSEEIFQQPDPDTVRSCPEYNHWLWGLEAGGDLSCPYWDNAIGEVRSRKRLAERYAARDVIYLSGENDVIPQLHDHCSSLLQGPTRKDRARHYVAALQEVFGYPVHELLVVPSSGHDHALMFQSEIGRAAILGRSRDSLVYQREDEHKKVVSQTSRFIVPVRDQE